MVTNVKVFYKNNNKLQTVGISEIFYPLFFVVTPQISTRKEMLMSGAFV